MDTFRELNRSARKEARRTLVLANDDAYGDFPYLFLPHLRRVALRRIMLRRATRLAIAVGLCVMGAAALLIVCCALAFAGPRPGARSLGEGRPMVIGHSYADHHGGDVGAFAARYGALRASGQKVVIDGECVSACTIVASLPRDQVCITPRAVLGVHLEADSYVTPWYRLHWTSERYTNWFAALYYTAPMRKWIKAHGGWHKAPTWIFYRSLLGIGFQPCPLPHRYAVEARHLWRWTGHPENPALHAWFDQLASGNGLCCSFADGVKIEVDEWDTLGSTANGGSGYRVRLDGRWIDVPRAALVTAPNKAGSAYVWPYQDGRGKTQIRCFIPGAGT